MQQMIPPKAMRRCWWLFGQIAWCTIPSLLLVRFGFFGAAGALFWASVVAIFLLHLVRRDPNAFLTVYLGLVPAFMSFKYFSYAGPAYLAVAGIFFWAATSHEDLRYLTRRGLLLGAFAAGALYWWASFLATGDYAINFRVIELVLGATVTYLVARRRYLFSVSLCGIALSVIMIGIGVSPYGERLGELSDATIGFTGNPIILGLGGALVLVMSIAERGRWMFFFRSRLLKVILIGGTAICLLLSTSRGGWLVMVSGIAVIFATRPGQRKLVAGMGVALLAIIGILIVSGKGDTMIDYFARSAGDRGLTKATTGRSEQWATLPKIFMESPVYG